MNGQAEGGTDGQKEGIRDRWIRVRPKVSLPQKLPRKRWDDPEELGGEEGRGALLVSGLMSL